MSAWPRPILPRPSSRRAPGGAWAWGARAEAAMSVINKMLQDLDRRNAMAGAEAQSGAQSVKAVEFGEKGGDRDWFWRVVAALLLVAVGWVGWVAYQLQPR